MNRLYKIAILFIIIFVIGVIYALRSIDNTFAEDENTKVIYVTPITSAEKNLFL